MLGFSPICGFERALRTSRPGREACEHKKKNGTMPRLPTLHTAAANGRVEEAMDPSPALNQPPLAVSPADVVNRRAGTRSLAVRHRGQSNVWDVWTSPEARTAPMN